MPDEFNIQLVAHSTREPRDRDHQRLGRTVEAIRGTTAEGGFHVLMVRNLEAPMARAILDLPIAPRHRTDAECAPDMWGVCRCGAVHGEPCEGCQARGYHAAGCAFGPGNVYFACSNCDGGIAAKLHHAGATVGHGQEVEIEDIPEACPYCGDAINPEAAEDAVREEWWG